LRGEGELYIALSSGKEALSAPVLISLPTSTHPPSLKQTKAFFVFSESIIFTNQSLPAERRMPMEKKPGKFLLKRIANVLKDRLNYYTD